MQVKWLRRALSNLRDEVDYISRDNPTAAENTAELIASAVSHLAQFPAMGRVGRVYGTRELVIANTPYVVPYRVRDNRIEIIRVFHASRRWPDSF
ncbi:Addiction module toxin, RelE/StbE [Candidatus Koribacter versatilis Ellin345]|uniref:Addiction module toxin, RelE/StbE n=1 Tax=Koribacter versatilis (strain Ellin345) TaxID=204669 RepID=Q1IKP1_KORVE|nr:type II toxin-antitoxin system mRNA interferase toxin, RelE/StbE family [Candidatus Koribacter versatilis]ABF42559.1 Addiction module toxin, RelE/StbE [Candidatus Koribacter versatilis Ellin345]